MMLTVFKSKLHRATVTGADLNYEGSISIDTELCKAAGFHLNERVEIYNINNGERFATYVIPGKKGEIGLNGAAARLVHQGDKVIIVAYGIIDEKEAPHHVPTVVLLNDQNEVVQIKGKRGDA